MELGRAQGRPRQAGPGDDPLGRQLGSEVAEHGAVDGADDRDPVGVDHRDVDQVRRPALRRHRLQQVARQRVVALVAAGEVQDGPDAVHRGPGPLAAGQVAGQVADAFLVRPAVPAEHADLAAGVPQARDEPPSEGAGPAGDQDW